MFKTEKMINRKGEEFEGQQYYIRGDETLVGVCYGHFAPWTGPKGHGRMVTQLINEGCEKIFIVMPEPKKEKKLDNDRELFSLDQRLQIIEKYLKQENIDGVASTCRTLPPSVQFKEISRNAIEHFGTDIRVVFAVGDDRKSMVDSLVEFESVDYSEEIPGILEYIYLSDRGDNNTSGTAVRQSLLKNGIDTFRELTGYNSDMFEFMTIMIEKNEKEGLYE